MIPELHTGIDTLKDEATEKKYFDPANMEHTQMAEIIKSLDSKITTYKQYDETSNRYNDWQSKLSVPQTNFENLEELRTELTTRHLMWHSLSEWDEMTNEWKGT